MAKSQLQSNPNMMLFSGDNINIPNSNSNSSSSIQNPVFNPATNSISAALPSNLELNVSVPNSEKFGLNLGDLNNLNFNNNNNNNGINNNLRGAYPNGNFASLQPMTAALGVQNLNTISNGQVSALLGGRLIANNQMVVGENLNASNLGGVAFAASANEEQLQNLSAGLNLGLLGNGGLSGIPQGLNASLLPQPIPIQVPKNVNLGFNSIPAQGQIGGVAIIGQAISDKNSHMFNLNVQYKNQIRHQTAEVLDLAALESKVQNLTNLPDTELSAILSQLRIHESSLITDNEKLYKTLKRYESQNNVIMDTLKEQINETHNQLSSMVVEVPMNERPLITKEIEDQFTKSLSGYTINKNKYVHLKEIDPTELFNISNQIKKELDRNEKFYLHGDFNFYN